MSRDAYSYPPKPATEPEHRQRPVSPASLAEQARQRVQLTLPQRTTSTRPCSDARDARFAIAKHEASPGDRPVSFAQLGNALVARSLSHRDVVPLGNPLETAGLSMKQLTGRRRCPRPTYAFAAQLGWKSPCSCKRSVASLRLSSGLDRRGHGRRSLGEIGEQRAPLQAAGGVRGEQPRDAPLALLGLAAERELAVDDRAAQRALGVVVGRLTPSCGWRTSTAPARPSGGCAPSRGSGCCALAWRRRRG